jgi:hypothetical protein
MALRDRLEDTEFKELIRLQGEASDTPDVAQTEVQTTMQRMNMRLAEIGLDPTPKGKEAAKRVGKAWATLSANIREAEAAAGRKLTPEQRDAQIDRLFASVEVRGSLFGTTDVALFEVEPGKEVVTVTVPEFDRRQITAALRAQGKEVSEANIQYYFKKAQGFIK